MDSDGFRRDLSAIRSADVAGYSVLMGHGEEAALFMNQALLVFRFYLTIGSGKQVKFLKRGFINGNQETA